MLSVKDRLDMALYNIYNDSCREHIKNERLKLMAKAHNIDIEDIKERYMWLVKMGIDPNICHLEENHNLIYKIFDEYNKMLNENNIEYYYTSGILAYLLVDKELERYHHDLDIFINMDDLEKLENICSKYGFSFERKMGERGDGTERVMLKMYYQDIVDIPITIFMYVREEDNSIIQKDYFIDEDGGEWVEYIYNSPVITELSFSDMPKVHNNIKYYSITKEALYLSKKENRPKDIYDCQIFKDSIDMNKLKRLEDSFIDNLENKIITACDDENASFIFNSNIKKKVLVKND